MYEIGGWIPLSEARRLPAVCGLYVIRHTESGKEYVGKSIAIKTRIISHLSATRKGSKGYLHRAFRKHGIEAFEICVYMIGNESEVTELEILLIEERGTFNPAGYNQTIGGDGVSGYRATAEARARMSATRKGRPISEETKRKMSETATANNPFKGRQHSLESLIKISEAGRVRRPISPEGRAAIAESNSRKKGTTWARPHSELTKLRLSLIKRGVPKPEGFGDKLRGEKNPMHGVRGAAHPRAKIVAVWLPDSMTPVTFDSASEAAAWACCNPASISDWCSGRYKPKNGYLWTYL